jgi:hypothetical protein
MSTLDSILLLDRRQAFLHSYVIGMHSGRFLYRLFSTTATLDKRLPSAISGMQLNFLGWMIGFLRYSKLPTWLKSHEHAHPHCLVAVKSKRLLFERPARLSVGTSTLQAALLHIPPLVPFLSIADPWRRRVILSRSFGERKSVLWHPLPSRGRVFRL